MILDEIIQRHRIRITDEGRPLAGRYVWQQYAQAEDMEPFQKVRHPDGPYEVNDYPPAFEDRIVRWLRAFIAENPHFKAKRRRAISTR